LIASVANNMLHPYTIFNFYAGISIFHTFLAYFIEEIQVENNIGAWENIKRSISHISKKIVFGTMLFMLISRAAIPSYSDIMYYFMINVLDFSKSTIALLALISFATAIVGSFIYNICLKNLEFRVTMVMAHLTIGVAIMSTFLLVTRISKEVLGINDIVFSFFTDAALEVLFVAFIFMPTLVVQTKIVPKNVEATVYSAFASLRNVANDFIAPMMGGMIAKSFNVTKDNFDNIGKY